MLLLNSISAFSRRKPINFTTMRTAFILLLFSILCHNALGQSSYSFSVDSVPTSSGSWNTQNVQPCVDGGYLRAETISPGFSDEYRLIKFSADGTIEWSRTSNFGTNYVELQSVRSFPMQDSGFVVSVYMWDFMFAQFISTHTMRLNKYGDIVYGKRCGGIPGVSLQIADVDTVYNFPLVTYGITQYDPIEDEPCCYQSFYGRLSPLLQVMGTKNILRDQNNLPDGGYNPRYFYENGIATGILMSTLDFTNRRLLTRLDLADSILWRKGYDQFYMVDMVQIGESIYMSGDRLQDAAIRKIDFNGNTIFDKTLSIPTLPNLMLDDIVIKNDSTLLITAYSTHYFPGAAQILIEIDTLGNVVQAYSGTDATLVYGSLSLDAKTGIAYNCHKNYRMVEKLNIDSLACNYQPISITATDFLTIDSSFTATVYGSAFTLVNDSLPTYPYTASTTPICGFLTDVTEINASPSFQMLPNPAYDQVMITGTDKISEITILSMSGSTIFDEKADSDQVSVDVSQWSAGIYFVRIISGDHVTTMKLLKTD